MTILLTGIWREIPAYERKINIAIEELSKETEIPDDLITTIIDEINYKDWATWKDKLQEQIKENINEKADINPEHLRTDLEEKIIDYFKPETNQMKSILEWNINTLYNQLLKWGIIDKKSSKIIQELIVHIILLESYEKKEESIKSAENKLSNVVDNVNWSIIDTIY